MNITIAVTPRYSCLYYFLFNLITKFYQNTLRTDYLSIISSKKQSIQQHTQMSLASEPPKNTRVMWPNTCESLLSCLLVTRVSLECRSHVTRELLASHSRVARESLAGRSRVTRESLVSYSRVTPESLSSVC